MTREEQAIEYIKKYRELDEKLYNTAPKGTVSSIATKKCLEFWDMAISALEQMPEVTSTMQTGQFDYVRQPCDDAVSREAVLLFIEKVKETGMANYGSLLDIATEVRNLPSVNVRQTGEWIEQDGYDGDVYYDCSVCGESWTTIEGTPWDNGMKFCPNCGARMEGAE